MMKIKAAVLRISVALVVMTLTVCALGQLERKPRNPDAEKALAAQLKAADDILNDAQTHLVDGDASAAELLAMEAEYAYRAVGIGWSAALQTKAEALIDQRRYADAVETMRDVKDQEGTYRYWANLAIAYARSGDLQRANDALSHDISMDREINEGETNREIAAYPLKDKPTLPDVEATALIYRTKDCQSQIMVKASIQDLLAAYKLAPGNAWIAYLIGKFYYDAKKYSDAKPYFQACVDADGYGVPMAKQRLGWIHDLGF